MSRTFRDVTSGVRPRRREQERRVRKARQLSLRFATNGRIARVRVPRDVLGRLEVLYR